MNYRSEVVLRLHNYDKCKLKKSDAKIIQRFLKSCLQKIQAKNEEDILLAEQKYKMQKKAYVNGSTKSNIKPQVSIFHPIGFQVDKCDFSNFFPPKDDPFEAMLRQVLPDPTCAFEFSFPRFKPYIEKQLLSLFKKHEIQAKGSKFSKDSDPLQLTYLSRINVFVHAKLRIQLEKHWDAFCAKHKAYRKISPRIEFMDFLQI